MSSASIKKIIPCSKKNLIDMVLDIEKYSEFVPWCMEGKINEKKESEDFIEIKADLKVGKKFLNEIYSSLVLYSKKEDTIIVTNIKGPLKYLKNEWKFRKINNSTMLEFSIDFELKNNFLNMIMKNSFSFGLNKIADAFDDRAKKIFK
jgi:coenzyme Q-binding protein COQ10